MANESCISPDAFAFTSYQGVVVIASLAFTLFPLHGTSPSAMRRFYNSREGAPNVSLGAFGPLWFIIYLLQAVTMGLILQMCQDELNAADPAPYMWRGAFALRVLSSMLNKLWVVIFFDVGVTSVLESRGAGTKDYEKTATYQTCSQVALFMVWGMVVSEIVVAVFLLVAGDAVAVSAHRTYLLVAGGFSVASACMHLYPLWLSHALYESEFGSLPDDGL